MFHKKFNRLLHIATLGLLLLSFVPATSAAQAAPPLPPVDMFQLPWERGIAWVTLDVFDNGSDRPPGSAHNYLNGGAIDFAPRLNMVKGEDTSNAWVTAAAAGTVVAISQCHLIIAHSNGWITEYQHLANFQVQLGAVVQQNQRLAVIANAGSQPVCLGSVDEDTPHLHFTLRPNMVGATFAGWVFNYNPLLNLTTFTRDGVTVGQHQPLLNAPLTSPTTTPLPGTPGSATLTAVASATSGAATQTAIASSTPATATPTPSGPFVSTTVDSNTIPLGGSALVTVRLNNVPPAGYSSAEFSCVYNANLLEVNNIVIANLFGADPVSVINGPQNGSFIVAIAGSQGNRAITDGIAFTFNVRGLTVGQSGIDCDARVSQGTNVLTDIPSIGTSISVIGSSPTSTPLPPPTTPVVSATPTSSVPGDWLTYLNLTYGFEFKYPPRLEDQPSPDPNYARIDLPFVQGTNLTEKYLEVIVTGNVNQCQSPLQTPNPSETVVINGISFLRQTGADAGVGHLREWIAYSTVVNEVCVSMDFILHSLNPDNSSTPPPAFDFAAESVVFGQIMSTFRIFLELIPTDTPTPANTATPTLASSPVGSTTPTLAFTPLPSSTAVVSPTATPTSLATLTGDVTASKVVTVRLFDLDENFVAAMNANPDGTFGFDVAPGSYMVIATADGFMRAQGTITLASGEARSMPDLALHAGDIDDNGEIDQFDAMTIGMNYNTAFPSGADFNNDGIINILDLELLAQNYREIGPTPWQ